MPFQWLETPGGGAKRGWDLLAGGEPAGAEGPPSGLPGAGLCKVQPARLNKVAATAAEISLFMVVCRQGYR